MDWRGFPDATKYLLCQGWSASPLNANRTTKIRLSKLLPDEHLIWNCNKQCSPFFFLYQQWCCMHVWQNSFILGWSNVYNVHFVILSCSISEVIYCKHQMFWCSSSKKKKLRKLELSKNNIDPSFGWMFKTEL